MLLECPPFQIAATTALMEKRRIKETAETPFNIASKYYFYF